VTKFKYVFAVFLFFIAIAPATAGSEDLIDALLARARSQRPAEVARANLVLAAIAVPEKKQETSVIDELLARARLGRAIGLGKNDHRARRSRRGLAFHRARARRRESRVSGIRKRRARSEKSG
jgi:hypothetical protein